ncbi:MAG: methyltransferase domain-containing protein [Mariprofundaceae bacterium]|nr:methyltransferase domain-containing protein [Mariprofundaceae bacterium]
MKLYRRFLDGIPWYLARYYWWAYLWKRAVWFFDHQPVINAILFGQYQTLMHTTLERLKQAPLERVLQLTCVYGSLTPNLIGQLSTPLHITDAATIQLELARSKSAGTSGLLPTRMNAESLGYKESVFSTTVLFFLLHELPPEARRNTLSEAVRTLAPGGTLLITEYGPLPAGHWLYRFVPFRWLLTALEPFLNSFWHDNLPALVSEMAALHGKSACQSWNSTVFSGFYRVAEFKVSAIGKQTDL